MLGSSSAHPILQTTRNIALLCTCLASLCGTVRASPGVSSDAYRPPASADDDYAVLTPGAGAHLELTPRIHLDYLRKPVVYETYRGDSDSEQTALVRDQLRLWLGATLALWQRMLVFTSLPVDLVMTGETLGALPTATGAGLGDLGLGVRGLLLETGGMRLGVELSATFPTAHAAANDRPTVAGDSGATLAPRLLAEGRLGPLRIDVNLGLRLRRRVELPNLSVSHQLLYALGVHAPVIPQRLDASIEMFGWTLATDVGRRDTTSLEALIGLHVRHFPQWRFGVAVGAGLLRGYGTPDLRVLARASWTTSLGANATKVTKATKGGGSAPPLEAAAEQTAAPTPRPRTPTTAEPATDDDLDRDGERDEVDRCPALAGTTHTQGCPARVSFDPASGALLLDPMPVFAGGSAQLLPQSLAGLQSLGAALEAASQRPDELRLMVTAHLSSAHKRGPRDLATQRARAVGQWLNQHGAPPGQLELYDCGSARPLGTPASSERIELYLVTPLPPQGMPSTLGCTPITLQPTASSIGAL